jgi:hypothetical protein
VGQKDSGRIFENDGKLISNFKIQISKPEKINLKIALSTDSIGKTSQSIYLKSGI